LKENIEKTTKNLKVFQIVGMDQMEQRNILPFLRLKGFSKKAIHHELVAVFQENAVSYSSVTRFCEEAILGLNSEELSSSPKDDGLDEVNEAILLALSDEIFSSVPSVGQMAGRISIPKNWPTVYRRLVDFLYFTVRYQTSDIRHQTSDIKHLYWVPHKLSDTQTASQAKSRRVGWSIQLATSCCPSGIKDRTGIHIICSNP
jgi:hypothetical protein